ncbi:MAG: hypothetical protein ACXVGN_00080 [Mycobacteriaceae bacterium]
MPDNSGTPKASGSDTKKHHDQSGHNGNGDGHQNDNGNGNGNDGGGDNKHLRDMAIDYGWAMAVFNQFPELMAVFKDAVHNSWSVQRFQAEIQDTKWFKNHSDTWRTNTYLKLTDPQTYADRLNKVSRGLQDAAGQLGIEFKNHRQLQEMSEQAFLHGWDETKINNVLAHMVQINGQHTVGGELASIQDRLKNYALNNGISVTDNTMQGWLRSIVRGAGTEQEFQNYITKMAVAKFPNWKKELESGMSMADIAQPYRQQMADLLEINPNDISLNDKAIRNALSMKNDQGHWDSMSLGDFEDMVRQDHRWQYTDNARQQVSSLTAGLLQSFGLMA